jgi:hypothetical protein
MVSDRPGGSLSERNLRLRRSVKEAADHRDNPEVLTRKVSEVVENLVYVAAAAVDGTVPYGAYRERSAGRNPASAVSQARYYAAQSQLLEEAETLTRELRSQNFSAATVQKAFGAAPQGSETHPGEKAVSLAFEIASYVSLRDAEAYGRKAATLATSSSSKEIRATVSIGQYLLGPSPLMMANDVTKIAGDAMANINAARLEQCVSRVFAAVETVRSIESLYDSAAVSALKDRLESPSADPPSVDRPSVTETATDQRSWLLDPPSSRLSRPDEEGPSHPGRRGRGF